MSSILKALKKLEEEKSLIEEQKEINVSREILKQSAENSNMISWFWLLGCSATAVIIILTFALIHKSSSKVETISKLTSQSAPSLSSGQNLPGAPQLKVKSKEVRIVAPLSTSLPNSQQSRQKADQTGEGTIKNGKVEQPDDSLPATERQKAEQTVKTAPLQTKASSELPLTLSGIAWNKDSSDRLAIINGQPTATGETITGVVVEEILPDRVKLSRNGKTFELLLGKSARPE